MMKQYFDDLVAGIEGAIAADPESASPRKTYTLEVARLGQRLYGGEERVAWCGITAPFDLLTAMGVTSCFVEFVGAMLASTGMVETFLEEAEQVGFTGDICAYHRSVIGAARKGFMPEPDFLVATTCPCSGGVSVMEMLAKHFNKDLFVLNVPQEQTEQNVRDLADQIKEMVAFVEAHTGEPLDRDKLKAAVEKTNTARDKLVEVYQLASRVPSPVNGKALNNFGIVVALLLGTDAAVTAAEAFRQDFEQKVAAGVSGIADEKLRLMWIQNRIQFKNPIVKMMEEDYGAAIVIDELNDITWDPVDVDDPYRGMAERAMSIPFNGKNVRRVAHLRKLARAYKIDGAINPCHWGCRQGTGSRGLVGQGLKEIGVPVLNLEVDCVDPRNFAEGQLRTRIEAFTEMLTERQSPWS
jgi:benzoyl-CoA reductase/2-hydroxyglutaryl-CoA dehydratase subunit BcrC/BadD/HgdB